MERAQEYMPLQNSYRNSMIAKFYIEIILKTP